MTDIERLLRRIMTQVLRLIQEARNNNQTVEAARICIAADLLGLPANEYVPALVYGVQCQFYTADRASLNGSDYTVQTHYKMRPDANDKCCNFRTVG